MPMSPSLATVAACGALTREEDAEELRSLCGEIRERWQVLEAHVIERQNEIFHQHAETLEKLYGLGNTTTSSWDDGGLRAKVHDRVQKLVLAPAFECLVPRLFEENGSAHEQRSMAQDTSAPHPVQVVLERWEMIEPELSTALEAVAKTVQKNARIRNYGAGLARNAKAEEEQLALIWAPVQCVLQKLLPLARDAAELLRKDASVEVRRRAAQMAPIVARAVCDWHFQMYAKELDKLETWWNGARHALQLRPVLWQRLQENENLLMRRLDRGIEELRSERNKYVALATFGAKYTEAAATGNGRWPEESVALLAQATCTMRRLLRPIRDSAAWRIIDAAKALQGELLAESKVHGNDRSPWESVKPREGVVALCDELGIRTPPLDLKAVCEASDLHAGGGDPEHSALVFMQRVDRLTKLCAELRDLPDIEAVPDTGGIYYILEEVMQGLAYWSEELLAVMDEPSDAARLLRAWMHQWTTWGDSIGGHRLDVAMKSMPFKATLPADERIARRKRLALMRGLQSLLDSPVLRIWVMETTSIPIDAQVANHTEDAYLEVLTLEEPPTPDVRPRLLELGNSKTVKEAPIRGDQDDLDFVTAPALASTACTIPSSRVDESSQLVVGLNVEDAMAMSDEIVDDQRGHIPNQRQIPASTPSAGCVLATTSLQSPSASAAVDSPTKVNEVNTRRVAVDAVASASSSTCPSPACLSRPVTPSWLEPPWPRPDKSQLIFGSSQNSPLRPETASTVCDAAELVPQSFSSSLSSLPRWKSVNGQFVPLRPNSRHRLPPITSLNVVIR